MNNAHIYLGMVEAAPVVGHPRRHRYDPPLCYLKGLGVLPLATFRSLDEVHPTMRGEIGYVHCGPPAPEPRIPTPEEILAEARGLGDPWRDDVPEPMPRSAAEWNALVRGNLAGREFARRYTAGRPRSPVVVLYDAD